MKGVSLCVLEKRHVCILLATRGMVKKDSLLGEYP